MLVTAGATEALAATFLALCDPGDEVITFEPWYDAYAADAALAGRGPQHGHASARPTTASTSTTPAQFQMDYLRNQAEAFLQGSQPWFLSVDRPALPVRS